MSHSITSRRGTTRRRRRRSADRVAAGAQAPAQRPPQVDPLAVAVALGAARAPQRGRHAQPRHQLVELRELVRRERVEALLAQQLLVAGRERHRDLARPSGSSAPAPVDGGDRRGRRGGPAPRASASGRPRGRSSGGAGLGRDVLVGGRPRRSGRGRPTRTPPRTRRRTPCTWRGRRRTPPRAVQYRRRRRDRPDQRQRVARTRPRARR